MKSNRQLFALFGIYVLMKGNNDSYTCHYPIAFNEYLWSYIKSVIKAVITLHCYTIVKTAISDFRHKDVSFTFIA